MTIEDAFKEENLQMSDICDKADESEYWGKCFNFVSLKWYTLREDLSPKQNAWLQTIIDELIEERINKRTRR